MITIYHPGDLPLLLGAINNKQGMLQRGKGNKGAEKARLSSMAS